VVLKEAELMLDNADTGVPGGVRALDADGRQLVFRHGELQVELMLQTSRPGPVVWGKVFRADNGLPCAGARAALLDRTQIGSADTQTDDWGEFCLATSGGVGGVLRVECDGETFVCFLGDGGSRAAAENAA
jgi:hypothetical protein